MIPQSRRLGLPVQVLSPSSWAVVPRAETHPGPSQQDFCLPSHQSAHLSTSSPRFSSACPTFLLPSSPRARQGFCQARRLQPAPQKLQRFTPEHLGLLSDSTSSLARVPGVAGR